MLSMRCGQANGMERYPRKNKKNSRKTQPHMITCVDIQSHVCSSAVERPYYSKGNALVRLQPDVGLRPPLRQVEAVENDTPARRVVPQGLSRTAAHDRPLPLPVVLRGFDRPWDRAAINHQPFYPVEGAELTPPEPTAAVDRPWWSHGRRVLPSPGQRWRYTLPPGDAQRLALNLPETFFALHHRRMMSRGGPDNKLSRKKNAGAGPAVLAAVTSSLARPRLAAASTTHPAAGSLRVVAFSMAHTNIIQSPWCGSQQQQTADIIVADDYLLPRCRSSAGRRSR